MKNIGVFLFLFFCYGLEPISAYVVINCSVRYQYEVVQQGPIGYTNTAIGRTPIYVTSASGNKKTVWSDTYNVNVSFFSGKEYNEIANALLFNDNSIVALIQWADESVTTITVAGWVTKLHYITENEIKFNSKGYRVYSMNGYDSKRCLWELSF